MLDKAHAHNLHTDSLAQQIEKARNPETTPAAKIITEMRDNQESFFEYAQRKTIEHEMDLKQPLDATVQSVFNKASHDSIVAQQQREQGDSLDFDDYLTAYFNETLVY